MTPEAWSIIATGIAVLIAIAHSNRSIRAEFRAELKGEIGGVRREIEKLSERIIQVEASLNERISQVEESLNERISQVEASLTARLNSLEIELRERLARVEGVLGVIRDSVIGRGPNEPDARRSSAGSR